MMKENHLFSFISRGPIVLIALDSALVGFGSTRPSESDAVTSGNVMLKPLQYQALLLCISLPRIRE
jgi:hypothetical protein